MKSILLATILLIPLSAHADHEELCSTVATLAHSVMNARQSGVSLTKSLKLANNGTNKGVNNLTRLFVMEAFKEPRYRTEQYQSDAILDFENKQHLDCLENLNK